jgi:chromosome segregation ATPase
MSNKQYNPTQGTTKKITKENESNSFNTQQKNDQGLNSQNSASLKGKLGILEQSINDISNEMNAHKNEVTQLKSNKDSIQELLKAKHDEVKNTLIQDLSKVEEEMKKHFGHQKAENSRLQQQISQLKTEKIVLQQQLISLQKRIVDLEMQVGNDDDKNNMMK